VPNDAFVHDLQTGITTMVSVDNDGNPGTVIVAIPLSAQMAATSSSIQRPPTSCQGTPTERRMSLCMTGGRFPAETSTAARRSMP